MEANMQVSSGMCVDRRPHIRRILHVLYGFRSPDVDDPVVYLEVTVSHGLSSSREYVVRTAGVHNVCCYIFRCNFWRYGDLGDNMLYLGASLDRCGEERG